MQTDLLFAEALELDEADPLADFRLRFYLPADIVYLDGNSLGAPPRDARRRVAHLLDDGWSQRLVRGWNEGWIEMASRLGGKIATLIGADPDEVIVADSTSVNFFKLAAAAIGYQSGRPQVITEQFSFPTNRYILQGLCPEENLTYVPSEDGISVSPEAVEALVGTDTGVVALNHVNFLSSWLHPMARLNARAAASGALNLWDLSHSVGVVPIDVHRDGVDLAVGCTYKYLSGGPGSPAFLYVRRDLQRLLFNPIQGWFGRKNFFEFGADYEPADDIRRFQAGTPPIVAMTAMEAGLDLVSEAGLPAIRKKSVAMTEFLIKVWQEKLAETGAELKSPMNAENRGSHISLGHERAFEIDQALINRMGVIPDFRKPNFVRFGLAPLYNRFSDVYEGLERMRWVLEENQFGSDHLVRPTVT